MLETHPYGNFVPKNTRYLILGSFPGKPFPGNNWFYSSPRNQFWLIFSSVYHRKLISKAAKIRLLSGLGIAMADIILRCRRRSGTNLDTNLTDIVYNRPALEKIFNHYPIRKIYFTSRFVENRFRSLFNHVPTALITLPSPSPRYTGLTLTQKISSYASLLPKVKPRRS